MVPLSKDPTRESASPVFDVEAVRRREPGALAALFESHFDRVYGLVYRLLGDRTAAEDATQDVFLKLHRAAHTLDPARDPGPWITTIAYNVCRDLWRSGAYRLSRRASSIDDPAGRDGYLPPSAENPERDLLRSERERLVQEAIARLDEPMRAAVVLREYEGLGYEEIATIAGISPVAARKRYSRGLQELGKLLKGTLG